MSRDVAIVDTERCELGADKRAERVVADAGDERGAVAQPRRGHRDVGGAAAQKLAERLDVLQADTDLQGIDVDAAAPDGEDVKWLRGSQVSLPRVWVIDSVSTVPHVTGAVNTLS